MAARLASLCPDALLYIELAGQLEQSGFQRGLGEMQLNIYPMILAGLHRLGLPWEVAGKCWGVLISSLVVLPLYGWVRRQFDDRVALWACFLYALHTDLIAWSPETIRDPTFWFLFVLVLYLQWRAITEVRWGLFAAAGVAMILAVLTRVEGLFLIVPFGLWSLWRYRGLRRERGRLVVGLLVSLAILPVIVVLVNLACAGAHGRWELPRLSPLALIRPWVRSLLETAGIAAADPESAAVAAAAAPPLWIMARIFVSTLVIGFTPLVGCGLLVGLWGWRKTWFRRDHQPLFYVAVLILGAVWIEMWAVGDSCPRFVFPVVLAGLPFAALGWLWAASWLERFCRWIWAGKGDSHLLADPFSRRADHAAMGLAAVLAVVGVGCVLVGDCRFRNAQADLGGWIEKEFGPSPKVAGPNGVAQVIAYYARGECRSFPPTAPCESVVAMVQLFRPDVVLLRPNSRMNWDRCRQLVDFMAPHGWRPMKADRLPPGCEGVLVLAQHQGDLRMARRGARDE